MIEPFVPAMLFDAQSPSGINWLDHAKSFNRYLLDHLADKVKGFRCVVCSPLVGELVAIQTDFKTNTAEKRVWDHSKPGPIKLIGHWRSHPVYTDEALSTGSDGGVEGGRLAASISSPPLGIFQVANKDELSWLHAFR